MAQVTTVTPTTSTEDHRPPTPDNDLAGGIDLATVQGWTYLASFVASGLSLTYNSSGPSVDISAGRVARFSESGGQQRITVDAVSGASLASDATNYLYFRSDDVIEVRDADNPPSADALLFGRINTTDGVVEEDVRGRVPWPRGAFDTDDAPPEYLAVLESEDMTDATTRTTRERLADGETLTLLRAGVISDALSSTSGLEARVITESGPTTEHSTTARRAVGDPLVEISGPADVRFELSNQTGSTQNGVSGRWTYQLTGDVFVPEAQGERIWVSGQGSDSVYEYSTSADYDVSTVSLVQSWNFGNETLSPDGLTWSADGTKLYAGDGDGHIDQHGLTTAYDISTASYEKNNAFGTSPTDIIWKGDGTVAFVANSSGTSIDQYSVSTAWDIGSTTSDGSLDTSSEGEPKYITANDDGTRVYMNYPHPTDPSYFYQYDLSTPWDISTASLNGSASMSRDYSDIQWSADGTKFYAMYTGGQDIIPFSAGTAFDITTLTEDDFGDRGDTDDDSTPVGLTWDTEPWY